MRACWLVTMLGMILVGLFFLEGCGLSGWAIRKWGEPQYQSYQIDARNLAVFTHPRQRFDYTAQGIDAALSLAGDRAASTDRPLIVFIHGRGKHPEKAFGDDPETGLDILVQMRTRYSAEVLMVHWPSWLDVMGYPSLNAREAGPHLQLLFERLYHFRDTGGAAGTRPLTLFVHSMGNQLLSSYMEDYPGNAHGRQPLFETLILNAPDVDLEDHGQWVERIDFVGRIFILLNTDKDRLLQLSSYLWQKPRLGRQLHHADHRPEPLAKNADYVDLVHLGVNHDYFYGETLPPSLVEFYRRAISTSADPLGTPGLSAGDRDRLHLLRAPN